MDENNAERQAALANCRLAILEQLSIDIVHPPKCNKL
jgi:hypothetical protein